MTEEQRRALFALREALRLCRSARLVLVGDCRTLDYPQLVIPLDLVADYLDMHPDTAPERYLGDATQEAGGSWRFRVAGLGILRWAGAGTRAWWDTEAKRREVQLLAKGGRTFRLDFATSQVYEVLP